MSFPDSVGGCFWGGKIRDVFWLAWGSEGSDTEGFKQNYLSSCKYLSGVFGNSKK